MNPLQQKTIVNYFRSLSTPTPTSSNNITYHPTTTSSKSITYHPTTTSSNNITYHPTTTSSNNITYHPTTTSSNNITYHPTTTSSNPSFINSFDQQFSLYTDIKLPLFAEKSGFQNFPPYNLDRFSNECNNKNCISKNSTLDLSNLPKCGDAIQEILLPQTGKSFYNDINLSKSSENSLSKYMCLLSCRSGYKIDILGEKEKLVDMDLFRMEFIQSFFRYKEYTSASKAK
jgi:hypothetical protein